MATTVSQSVETPIHKLSAIEKLPPELITDLFVHLFHQATHSSTWCPGVVDGDHAWEMLGKFSMVSKTIHMCYQRNLFSIFYNIAASLVPGGRDLVELVVKVAAVRLSPDFWNLSAANIQTILDQAVKPTITIQYYVKPSMYGEIVAWMQHGSVSQAETKNTTFHTWGWMMMLVNGTVTSVPKKYRRQLYCLMLYCSVWNYEHNTPWQRRITGKTDDEVAKHYAVEIKRLLENVEDCHGPVVELEEQMARDLTTPSRIIHIRPIPRTGSLQMRPGQLEAIKRASWLLSPPGLLSTSPVKSPQTPPQTTSLYYRGRAILSSSCNLQRMLSPRGSKGTRRIGTNRTA